MADLICTICGYEGRPKKRLRGSGGVEWFLWLTLLIPGPFYSLWRRVGVKTPCPNCRNPVMVKKSSTAGQMAQRKLDAQLGLIVPEKNEIQSLTVNAPRAARENKRPVDPEKW